jgi:hypothetical protein
MKEAQPMTTIRLTGRSGQVYFYELCQMASAWFHVPGNYVFVKPATTLLGAPTILYVGQTESFKTRMPTHERWGDAIRASSLVNVYAHRNDKGQGAREAEEKDLIGAFDPPMNKHYRPVGLGNIFASPQPPVLLHGLLGQAPKNRLTGG